MIRPIRKKIQGKKAIDGAGVHLVRVLGIRDVQDFDPFLMFDSFDSKNPEDYLAGFPTHPHRGIETITYLISGAIAHEDSLGNQDTIHAGESQWMTAGSGILHQEMPLPSEHMLGFQLWLNLSKEEKMTSPKYLSITKDKMPLIQQEGISIRVISGAYGDMLGVTPPHIQATIYDISLEGGKSIQLPTKREETVFIFLIQGNGVVNGELISSKTAVLFEQGDYIQVEATAHEQLRFIFFSGMPLQEPIAWGGPIVMNTKAELELAAKELRDGNFIKHQK